MAKALRVEGGKEYIFNLFKNFNAIWLYLFLTLLALVGFKRKPSRGWPIDDKYMEIDDSEIHAALEHTFALMSASGWEKWIAQKRDCDDYAGEVRSEANKFIIDNNPDRAGAGPFRLFGYTKTNGNRHVCVMIEGQDRRWFEVYPWLGVKELILTPKEQASVLFIY